MSNPLVIGKNLANLIIAVAASALASATAGGAGDNVAVVGLTIDRENLTPYGTAATLTNTMPIGAVFEVFFTTSLSASFTLTLKNALVQSSPDGTTWTTLWDQTGVAAPVPVGWPTAGIVASATGVSEGCVAFGCDLSGAQRYVRFEVTPDLSNTVTDTASIAAIAVLSGLGEVPASAV